MKPAELDEEPTPLEELQTKLRKDPVYFQAQLLILLDQIASNIGGPRRA